jgi:cytochrome c biogenesis protein ResB
LLRKLLGQLGSTNLGLALLGLLALSMMAGGTLPQRRRFTSADFDAWRNRWTDLSAWLEWSGLTDIYASSWFSALALALALNLAVAMAFHLLRTRAWLIGKSQPAHTLSGQGEIPPAVLSVAGLRYAGTKLTGLGGLWGIPLLHAGIVVIVLASFAVRAERFAAHLELAEGESFTGQSEKLIIEGDSRPPSDLPFGMRIDALDIVVQDGKHLRELDARISLQEHGDAVTKEVLRVNFPVRVGGYDIYLDKTFGWTAVFDRVRANGEQTRLLVNFPATKSQWPARETLSRQTTVTLDDQPMLFDMRLTPGETPRFSLTASQENRQLFDGEIELGASADLGHYRLIFRGCTPWAGLYLAKDNWTVIIFLGFILAIAGALLQLIFKPRRIVLATNGNSWSLSAWTQPDDMNFLYKWTSLQRPNIALTI